jgi:hydroxyacylglutathione hydrolase
MQPLPLPALEDNYIWIVRDPAGRALIVDPGEAAPVLAALDGGPDPLGVLLTHHHPDHIGGVAALRARWPRLVVVAPNDLRIAMADRRAGDGDTVAIGDWRFATLAVPGHTASHVAYHGHGLLFSGDTLFSLGCGRLFEGTPAQMLGSLDRLAALPDATLVCCGHEYTRANGAFAHAVEPDNPALRRRIEEVHAMRDADRPSLPSTIAGERAANPFLRVDAPAVRAAAERHAGRPLAARVDVFAELRGWKDGFAA